MSLSTPTAVVGTVLLSIFPSGVTGKIPETAEVDWPGDFLQVFEVPSLAEKTSVPLFIPGTFKPGTGRGAGITKANLEQVTLLVFDYDGGVGVQNALTAFGGLDFVLYTTARHEAKSPRFRVCVRLARYLDVGHYDHVIGLMAKYASDRGAPIKPLEDARGYFFATHVLDGVDRTPVTIYSEGLPLNPEILCESFGRPLPPIARSVHGVSDGTAPTVEEDEEGRKIIRFSDGYTMPAAETQHFAGIDFEKPSPPTERLDCIEAKCAFMAHCRSHAATLKEPSWRAWLAVLNRCVDGRQHAHEIGKAHPTYSEAGTNAKMDRLQAEIGGKPMTCEAIRKLDGNDACDGCTIGQPVGEIVTPAQLGRPDPETATPEEIVEDVKLRAEAEMISAVQRVEQARERLDTAARLLDEAKAVKDALKFSTDKNKVAEANVALTQSKDALKAAQQELKYAERATAQIRRRYEVFQAAVESEADPGTLQRLKTDRYHVPIANKTNLETILTVDPKFANLWYDEYEEKLLYGTEDATTQDTRRTVDIERRYQMHNVETSLYREVVLMVGRSRGKHPLREYLQDEISWDGTPRLNMLMERGFGAISDVPGYLVKVSRKLCIAAVARVFEPGKKLDEMVIITGPEGKKKSSTLEALAGERWFKSGIPDLKNKDSLMALAGCFFYEIGELASFEMTNYTVIRQFISQQIDRYRPPYGASMVNRPRQGIIVGTTNERRFNNDPHGFRRFIAVIATECDPDWVREYRDQLWAEAFVAYRAGEQYWWSDADGSMELLRAAAEEHRVEEPWYAAIVKYIDSTHDVRDYIDLVHPSEILTSPMGLGKPAAYAVSKRDTSTVTRILEDHLNCVMYHPPADEPGGTRPPRMWRLPEAMYAHVPAAKAKRTYANVQQDRRDKRKKAIADKKAREAGVIPFPGPVDSEPQPPSSPGGQNLSGSDDTVKKDKKSPDQDAAK